MGKWKRTFLTDLLNENKVGRAFLPTLQLVSIHYMLFSHNGSHMKLCASSPSRDLWTVLLKAFSFQMFWVNRWMIHCVAGGEIV